MTNNTHFGSGFGPLPVRRVPMPKFEFALEKFLEERRKRPKDEESVSRRAPPGRAMPAMDRSRSTV